MEITGKIKVLNETQTIGASGFRKREVVIATNEQYPQTILIEFVQDKCDLLNNYTVNDEVTIAINLRGKEWISPEGQTKYFNSVNGWKIQNNNEPNSKISTSNPISDVWNNNEEFLDSSDSESSLDKLPF